MYWEESQQSKALANKCGLLKKTSGGSRSFMAVAAV